MRDRLLPIAVLLLIAAIATFAVEGFVTQVVLRPLLYTLWVGELFVRSLPQSVYWGLLTLAAAYCGLRSATWPRRRPPRAPARASHFRGPVGQWQKRLQRAQALGYGRWTLARALRQLTLDILDDRDGLASDADEPATAFAKHPLPARFQAYFEAQVDSQESGLAAAKRWLAFGAAPARAADPLQTDPEEIVAYLETHTRARTRP